MNRGRDTPSRRIEIERLDELQFDVLAGFQRLMRIGKRHQHPASIFEMNVILVAEVLDAMNAADDLSPIRLSDLKMFGTDTDGFGPGRDLDLGD